MPRAVPANFKLYLAIAVTIIFWSSAFVGIRIGLDDFHPGSLALLRYSVASLCLFAMSLCIKKTLTPNIKETLQLFALGVIGIGIYNICLNFGEMSVSAGVASFTIGLGPVLVVFMSMLFFKEKLSSKAWLGLAISLIGISVMSFSELLSSNFNTGILIVFLSTCAYAIYNLFQKPFLNRFHPIQVTAYIIWGGTLLLSLFSRQLIHDLHHAHWQSTLAAIYMGIFPASIAYASWGFVIKYISPARAVMFLYCSPIIATFLGVVLLNESPAIMSLIGGGIALIGALLTLPRTTKEKFQNDQLAS